MDLSRHVQEEIERRGIPAAWVWRVVQAPDRTERAADGTIHYIKSLPEFRGRHLRVVVNPRKQPPRIATAFFDARLRRRPPPG